MTQSSLEVASAHGRFQLVHNGHIEYLRAAKSKCGFLYIGITQVDLADLLAMEEAGAHRADPRENPLTYHERESLLHEAMLDLGISSDEFKITPFPIERPQSLTQFLPVDVPIFTTIYDDWNRSKLRLLSSLGYDVRVLWERENKEYTGSVIRRLVANSDDTYQKMVPEATIRFIAEHGIEARLARLVR